MLSSNENMPLFLLLNDSKSAISGNTLQRVGRERSSGTLEKGVKINYTYHES